MSGKPCARMAHALGLALSLSLFALPLATPVAAFADDAVDVTFADAALYAAVLGDSEVRDHVIGSDDGTRTIRLAQETIDSVSDIAVDSQSPVTSLSGIEAFENLESLYVTFDTSAGTESRSLEPLRGLQHLDMLRVFGQYSGNYGCLIDLEPLSGITALRRLDCVAMTAPSLEPLRGKDMRVVNIQRTHTVCLNVSPQGFTDITPLAGMGNLEHLTIVDYDIGDGEQTAATLATLRGLTYLKLRGHVGDADMAQIGNLTHLQELWLGDLNEGGNDVTDISPIRSLAELKTLYLGYNEITDISPLSGLTSLRLLDLRGNKVTDVSPLSGLTGLESLSFGRDSYDLAQPLDSIEPLGSLTGLKELKLARCGVTDLSPLSGLTGLEVLHLNHNQIADVTPIAGLPKLGTLQVVDNSLDSQDALALSRLPSLGRLEIGGNHVDDLTMFESPSTVRVGAPGQSLTARASRGETIPLPAVFRQSQDEGSRFFHHRQGTDHGEPYDDSIQCEGCSITPDGLGIAIDADAAGPALVYLVGKGMTGGNASWTNAPLAYTELAIELTDAATYSVTYDCAGGTMPQQAPASQTKTRGVPLTLLGDVPTRQPRQSAATVTVDANGGELASGGATTTLDATCGTSWAFAGWHGSDGRDYAPSATYDANADLVLTAQWRETPIAGSVTLPEARRDGYALLGFYTEKDAGERVGGAGDQAMVSGDMTLYAHWQAAEPEPEPEPEEPARQEQKPAATPAATKATETKAQPQQATAQAKGSLVQTGDVTPSVAVAAIASAAAAMAVTARRRR